LKLIKQHHTIEGVMEHVNKKVLVWNKSSPAKVDMKWKLGSSFLPYYHRWSN